jgi:CRP-like cAMP-binding protein
MGEQLFQMQTFTSGSIIAIEGGRKGDHFHIVTEGQVVLRKKNPVSGEDAAQYLGKGDFFGIITAMTGFPHLETATASGSVGVISVHRDRFADLIRRNTPLAMKIIRSYSLRLRSLDAILHNKDDSSVSDPINEMIRIADGTLELGNKELAGYMYQSCLEFYPEGSHRAKCIAKLNYLNKTEDRTLKSGSMRTYDKGEIIFCEGEPAKELYIVQAGRVQIIKYADGKEIIVNNLKDGDIFGEMALLDNKPRYASAIPLELSNIIVMSKDNFGTITETNPGLMAKVITVLSERVWVSHKKAVNSKISDINYRFADILMILAEQAKVRIAPRVGHNYKLSPEDLLHSMGLGDTDMPNLIRFIKSHTFLTNDGRTITCTDMSLLELAVKGFKDKYSKY